MNPKWAEENLQTIRTLMERSALYRRALAPVMIFVGMTGILGGLIGYFCQIESGRGFVWLWLAVAIFSLIGSLFLVRRQALKDSEPFWSPPTRRVGQALMPGFFVGLMIAVFVIIQSDSNNRSLQFLSVLLWAWFYGCAVHAAGFFMPRGVRWLGWVFMLIGGILLAALGAMEYRLERIPPHLVMGGIFGSLHLAYGIYLYFTEKKNPVA